MNILKTSVFPASQETVFCKLQRFETLRYIASPYASFDPVTKTAGIWTPGSVSSYRLRLFGLIPFGTHTIGIVQFDQNCIVSHEHNEHVPVWNHRILLSGIDSCHTEYTDCVEIHAGWKTIFIFMWASLFYAHRQRKWIRLLEKENRSVRQ